MRITIERHTCLRLLLLLLITAASPVAQTTLSGELGLNLYSNSFNGSYLTPADSVMNLPERWESSEVNRTLSSHFINMGLSGPLVNSHFANYAFSTRVLGSYYSASSSFDNKSQYLSPDLNNYYAQVTMFPNRRYPLQLYRHSSVIHSLRYESANRNDLNIFQRGLAVVRRYEDDKTSNGMVSRVALTNSVRMLAEYRQDKGKSRRHYDFEEDRDIAITIIEGLVNKLDEYRRILIKNEIPETSVRVSVGDSVLTLLANESVIMTVDSGQHVVEIIPLTYYRQRLFSHQFNSDETWTIFYKEPPSPNDQNQSLTVANMGISYDGGGSVSSDLFIEHSDQEESMQGMSMVVSNLSNSGSIELSRLTNVQLLTTYSNNKTDVIGSSSQESKGFLHMTTANSGRQGGLNGSLTHSFASNSSVANSTELSSTMNTFSNEFTLPSRRLKHRLNIKNNASLLSDNIGTVTNQYSSAITNKIELRYFGVDFEPKNEFKYSINKGKNPHKDGKDLETRFSVRGDISNTRLFGDVLIKSFYNYRKKYDALGSDIKKNLAFDIAMTRKFNKTYRLMLLTTQENETYGGSTPTPGANADQKSPTRFPLHKASYKIDFQFTPSSAFNLATNFMLISQSQDKTMPGSGDASSWETVRQTTTIQKLNVTLNMVVPYLKIPVKSLLTTEKRSLVGLPAQTQTSISTKVGYNFRQMSLVVSHSYTREKLIASTFTYQELSGKLTRRISIF